MCLYCIRNHIFQTVVTSFVRNFGNSTKPRSHSPRKYRDSTEIIDFVYRSKKSEKKTLVKSDLSVKKRE